ncbi:IS1595 family transposase [Methyloligella solikamskensis]|uniref:IS1595 family transposase n=1 Tax=Methyloligella solikamskensis TaxID=1177756 RepID=A0ABW3JAH2_9HYPH
MAKSVLSDKHFHDEKAAYAFVEKRVWPNGPVCPHCGGVDRISPMKGKSTRIGTYKCYQCRKPFTVKVGTIFESSHVALHLWLQAIFLMSSAKKGISSNQLHRTLGVTLKTAWFMGHRIREAMRDGNLAPMGGSGKIVEADETYYGSPDVKRTTRTSGEPFNKRGSRGPANKRAIVALVERGGSVRSFHVAHANKININDLVNRNISRETQIYTDESRLYGDLKNNFAGHDTVRHAAGEYARGPVHSNTVENVFSVFKRGMRGTYQHCREKHLHRYLAEFDFRYNARTALGVDDVERAERALKGVVGKRLTYQTTC